MDTMAALEAFVRVAESGSFSEAARQLQLANSVVSKRIVDLERDFGVALLHRTTRRVSLTDAGERLLERAVPALVSIEAVRQELGGEAVEAAGRLRISSPTSFGSLILSPAVCEFRERHPRVQVELILNDGPVNPASAGFDLVIDDSNRLPGTVVATRIAPMERVLVASPSYLRRAPPLAHPRDLRAHDCIHYSELESGAYWRFTGARGRRHDVPISPALSSNNARVMCDAAIAGQGLAVLPDFVVESALDEGALVRSLDAWQVPPVPLAITHARSAYMPLRTRLMREFLAQRFAPASD